MKTFKLSDYCFAVFIAALVLIFLIYCTGCDSKSSKSTVDESMIIYKLGYTHGINNMFKAAKNYQIDSAYAQDTLNFKKYLQDGK